MPSDNIARFYNKKEIKNINLDSKIQNTPDYAVNNASGANGRSEFY